MGKKLFITGISGFIGTHMAEEGLRRGYEVSGLDTKPCSVEGASFINADITDRRAVDDAIKEADFVIHLAAVTASVEFNRRMRQSYAVNVDGFLNVIDASARAGCKRFVYASSAAVYADKFSEDSVIDVRKQANPYAKTKLIDEMVAQSYESKFGMKAIGVRYFNTYGPLGIEKGEFANLIDAFIKCKLEKKPLVIYGDGSQRRDNIYIDDAVALTYQVLEKGTESVYNIGSGASTSFKEIAEIIDKDGIEYVGNPIPRDQYQYFTEADTRRILALCEGFKFTGVRQGIAKTLEYYGRKRSVG
jgi:nucleoside-diphosphate-sugar epimerase